MTQPNDPNAQDQRSDAPDPNAQSPGAQDPVSGEQESAAQGGPDRAAEPQAEAQPESQQAASSSESAANEALEALKAVQSAVTQATSAAGTQQPQPEPASGADPVETEAMRVAQEAVAAAREASGAGQAAAQPPPTSAGRPAPAGTPLDLPSFSDGRTDKSPEGIDLLSNVNLKVRIELGRTRMLVEDVLRLGDGSVVELDKLAGDPVDVYVNDRHIARGEVLVLNDNFCVRISEILSRAQAAGEDQKA